MEDEKDRRRLPKAPSGTQPEAADAFDIWLHGSLHRLYDGVTREPIPPELLALIEKDRRRGR